MQDIIEKYVNRKFTDQETQVTPDVDSVYIQTRIDKANLDRALG